MSLSIYSRGGLDGDFYNAKLTKLGSDKEKVNIALILGIMLHFCMANKLFSIHYFTRFSAFQILILLSSGRKLWEVGRCPLLDRTYGHRPSYTSLESH